MGNRVLTFTILALVLWIASCNSSSERASEGQRSQSILTSTAQKRDLSDIRTVSAPVVAYLRVYITARTAGQVMEVNFEEGDRVRKGQVLARLDTRRQQAQLRNAEATLKEARLNYDRQKTLFEQDVITPAEFENAQVALERAEAEKELWRVEVDLGEISAPIDAVVAAKLVEPGTTANVNDRLFTIEDHNLLVMRPALSELDVASLEKGQNLELYFDVFGDKPYLGKIRRIFPSADGITRLFTVEVEIDQVSLDQPVKPGYLARARFVLDDRRNVISVPKEAVVEKNGQQVVFVLSDDREGISRRDVTTGAERDGWVEIISGLEEGKEVAAGNIANLSEDRPVRVTGNFRRYGFREE
ncbi:MAG: efflux RND transporter periplasmic adaptor subunit [Bacteroidales bacterium]|nr:efflux RND transporter periplasmic adaptor subunit [Bacteroidales bacterium]